MPQQGQVFALGATGANGTRWAYRYRVGGRGSRRVQRGGFESERAAAEALERELLRLRANGTRWAYRYRVGGRGSRRVQRGGFESERAAAEALERELLRLRRERGLVEAPMLSELVDVYLAQHGGEPETVEKLRWLLAKAVRSLGHRRISHLRAAEIATWRMTIPPGHRFEATQALRQVLGRAVSWGLIDTNPAKQGVDNPSAGARKSGRSSRGGLNSMRSPPNSDRATGRS